MKIKHLILILSLVITFSFTFGYADKAREQSEKAVQTNTSAHKNAKEITEKERRNYVARVCDAVCPKAPYLCKVAFCAVIIERCSDPAYPNTPVEVIFSDPEFIFAHDLDYGEEPSKSSLMAYDDAVSGFSPCPDALYYSTTESHNMTLKKRQTLFRIGKYIFS